MKIEELKKLVEERKAIKLPTKRKRGFKTQLLLEVLSTEAKTVKELAEQFDFNKISVYNTLKKLEKKGKIVAFGKGKEVYYVEKNELKRSQTNN